MCFFVIKVQYTPVVIWKMWYYNLYGTIFVHIRLYESLFITTADCVQVDFSNMDCMEVVIMKWLLWYAQVIVWNIICLNQIMCPSIFFQYSVWKFLLWNGWYGMTNIWYAQNT